MGVPLAEKGNDKPAEDERDPIGHEPVDVRLCKALLGVPLGYNVHCGMTPGAGGRARRCRGGRLVGGHGG